MSKDTLFIQTEHTQWLSALLHRHGIKHARDRRKSNGAEVLLLEIEMSLLANKLKAVLDDYDKLKADNATLTTTNATLTAQVATLTPDADDAAQLARLDTEVAALPTPADTVSAA